VRRVFPAVCAVAVVVAGGWVHGRWTNRWGASDELRQAVGRLERVPRTFGDWRGTDLQLDDRTIEAAGIAGYVWRRYENRVNGRAVSLLVVCGRAGQIAVHTPEVCYEGAGYEQVGSASVYRPAAAAGAAEFEALRFAKPGPGPSKALRILWACRGKGSWEAPAKPRVAFANEPALYKMYVVRDVEAADEELEQGAVGVFVEQLLPELDKALFAGS